MDTSPNDPRLMADQPFLQNAEGWRFFLRAVEVTGDRWRGVVGIHAGEAGLSGRLHCIGSRSTKEEALQDAKDFAWLVFRKIEEKLRASSPAAGAPRAAPGSRSCH